MNAQVTRFQRPALPIPVLARLGREDLAATEAVDVFVRERVREVSV